jgi:hypothetical protein
VFDKECVPKKSVPITIPFTTSGFRISNPSTEELKLRFSFRSDEYFGTLAYSEIRTLQGSGFWEVGVYTGFTPIMYDEKTKCIFICLEYFVVRI